MWKPGLHGVRVIALDEAGRVLLVRHSYGSDKWMPPGGGLKPHEDPVEAARRELREETGCTLAGARLLAISAEDLHGSSNTVRIVVGRTGGEPRVDGREIVEAAFFAPDALPSHMSAGLGEQVRGWAAEVTE